MKNLLKNGATNIFYDFMLVNRPSFWAQRSRLEKRLLLCLGVISVLAVAFLAAFLATALMKTSTDVNGEF